MNRPVKKKLRPQTLLLSSLMGLLLLSASGSVAIGEEKVQKDPLGIRPPEGLFPKSLSSYQGSRHFGSQVFLADKSQRTLSLWEANSNETKLLAYYPMDFGRVPGDKVNKGDKKTPEGIYFIQRVMRDRELNFEEYGSRAFTLNYPNPFDRFKRKTGSGIWLHAVPETKTLVRGSRGCLVVRNEIIKKLEPLIREKHTPVIIVDQATYLSKTEALLAQKAELKRVESWRQAWSAKNLTQYLSFYDEDFQQEKMNLNKWGQFKRNLNRIYKKIDVEISDVQVFKFKNQTVARFLQKYQSDKNSDFGVKYLYFRAKNGVPKILREYWEALPLSLPASTSTPQVSQDI